MIGAVVTAIAAVISMPAHAQDYPTQPVRMLGPLAGGGSDMVMRLIAPVLRTALGQPVIVDNRPSLLIPEVGMKAPPDGHTLLVLGSSFMIGHLIRDTPWDPVRDFAPVVLADTAPSVLLTHPSLPVKSVKELIALSKARPNDLNYASGTPGSSPHLATELFKNVSGAKMTLVAYKSNGHAMLSLIGGETHVMFKDSAGVDQFIKARSVRALAVTTAAPSPLFPDLPTLAASGVPGYEAIAIDAFYAPAKTPPAIINRLNQEIVRALNQPDVKQTLFTSGMVVAGGTPEQLGAFLKSEIAKWGKVIRDAGIRMN
jgi:tripartite-type tricarboxylate transporter receptor subunit TctC